ncbi:glycoside hydrolase family 16 protein [Lutimonas zeaxanthinifaciens]|uniref:glycoside hydrolase family 16 protein n=1 Tax=Lutimonas zeaxanthinifaciens TaxID=3060215 RepID=UPI00265C94F8|nr:glycoside hydrolase family 16 protein [Lutimonas sp. YSD2104]WKK65126.1 glycoside hydrolase family 16 protein [Lutimonas sp. YSD2104]
MKNILYLFAAFLFFGTIVWSCQEEVPELGTLYVPSNLGVSVEIQSDGSGLVNFQASATDALNYHFYFGNSPSEDPFVSSDGKASNFYKKTGTNDYLVKIVAFGAGGVSSSITEEITVFVDFEVPSEIIKALTNNGSKEWYWKQDVSGHLGVGPQLNDAGEVVSDPTYYAAAPNEKEGLCLYEDVLTFTDNGDGTFGYTLENQGNTFFHTDEIQDAIGEPGPGYDACYPYDTSGNKDVLFSPTDSGVNPSTGINMEFTNGGFMSYYLNSSSYEIMSITDTEMKVRVIQKRNGLAWYHIFTSEKTASPDPEFTDLVWQDEFDTDGAPADANWNYDIGTGSNGWGNFEEQYYTDRPENVIVADGVLKITARKENFSGKGYTSARLKTQDKFDFTYGRVDVKAKVAGGGGTWPAIWMLGSSITTVGWPKCGEMDIMEYVGNKPGYVQSAIHTPSSSGATVNVKSTTIENETTEFHVYSVIWSEEQISFLIDDQRFYTYKPAEQNDSTWPFDAPQFLILNVAMGGNLGGAIDPNFTESTMEIDYVRVYQ